MNRWMTEHTITVQDELGISLSLENTGGGCYVLYGRLESGHLIGVADLSDSIAYDPDDQAGWLTVAYGPDDWNDEEDHYCCPRIVGNVVPDSSPNGMVESIKSAMRLINTDTDDRGICCKERI